MPASLQQRLLEASWDKISAAVEAGLAGTGKESTLADVIPLSERPYGEPQVRFEPWPKAESPRHRIAAAAAEGFVEVRFDRRFTLDVDDLLAFDTDDALKEWAADARRRELTAVLQLLAEAGRPCPLYVDAIRDTLPAGHGTPAILLWEPLPSGLDLLSDRLGHVPKTVATPPVKERFRGVILRPAAGPSVRRGRDFALDWRPLEEGVELVLMAHLRVYNATADAVTTLVTSDGAAVVAETWSS
ncbi:MAG TPA: hypothetical protein VHX15_18735 [Frankiaceae bacterium]|nr:hypothetical protein [Frankiaceae bacterium]